MLLPLDNLTTEVKRRVPTTILQEIINFASTANAPLWGQIKGRGFIRRYVLLALYKDAFNMGYIHLYNSVAAWLKSSSKTLCHNICCLRLIFKDWATTRVWLGLKEEWDHLAANLKLKGAVMGTNLWMDSFDVRLEGRSTVSCKDPSWSYKCNSPGVCYMALQDAHSKFWALWGGYLPKIHRDFLKIYTSQLSASVPGAMVMVDCHFEWGKSNINSIKFITPFPQPHGHPCADAIGLAHLTAAQVRHNSKVHAACAHVEGGFGCIEAIFDTLHNLWAKGEEQLNTLVWTAVGIAKAHH